MDSGHPQAVSRAAGADIGLLRQLVDGPAQNHQLFGMADWNRLQHDGIQQAEDGSICADA